MWFDTFPYYNVVNSYKYYFQPVDGAIQEQIPKTKIFEISCYRHSGTEVVVCCSQHGNNTTSFIYLVFLFKGTFDNFEVHTYSN